MPERTTVHPEIAQAAITTEIDRVEPTPEVMTDL